ncbi:MULTISPECIES: peptidoglycan glycosyltransferase FtsW [Arsenicicoccus]|uniref:peptidoglycan glycosyltransferase FtsW n=1 Tax=Arsenicicoccus TaxID=267408 RepID=UPI000426DCE6|nr:MULTISPECIES: putative peptidoglycan glycosyltransferase FtsW [Arsenicicoccus]
MTTRPGASPTGASRARRTGRETLPDRVVDFLDSIDTPLTTYYLLASVTAALTIVGLVMYLSASSIRSYDLFLRQLLFAGIGLVLCVVASRLPVRVWKRLAWPGILLSLALQALIFVPGLGQEFQGNRNWIQVAGVQLQPSEFAKIAIVVFGAAILDRKKDRLGQFWHAVIPLGPAAVLLLGLQLAGNDLGTGLVLLAIVAGMLFAAGVSARFFGFAALLGVAAVAVMTLTSRNRLGRIDAWIGDGCATNFDLCRQVVNGKYALAEGGWWGKGLGESAEKWGWLSESRNDFIFAIIGEELGLPGTLTVLLLLALLAYACYRLVFRSQDFFVRIASAGVLTWLVVQASINIGAVTGLLPVIGVPLPLISGGGTALISTLTALGMLMAFAREEPGAREARSLRRSRPARDDRPRIDR